MRKRAERAQIWLTFEEKEDLRAKASAACMDEGRFIRMLIKGYAPRPAPDEQFYKTMDLIKTMGDRLELMESRITDPQVQQHSSTRSSSGTCSQKGVSSHGSNEDLGRPGES